MFVWLWAISATLLLGVSAWLNVFSLKRNLSLDDQREELVDMIEKSLDELDTIYGRLSHHAELPVLSDEPVIQDVVRDIKLARNAVLRIAGRVVTYGADDKEDETEE